MARQKNNENDFSTNEILSLLEQDIAQGRAMPLNTRFLEELKSLVGNVVVDLDQRLHDDEIRNH